MQFRALLVATTMVLAAVAGAKAQSVSQTLAEAGLIGTWATDCSQPASNNNYLTVYAIKSASVVSRTYYDGPSHVFNNYKIVSAKRLAPGMFAYTQVWDFNGKPAKASGDRVDVVVNIVDGKFQIVSSQGSDGDYFVLDRKFPGSGADSPWQHRCPAQ
jgi:hypothetical protein